MFIKYINKSFIAIHFVAANIESNTIIYLHERNFEGTEKKQSAVFYGNCSGAHVGLLVGLPHCLNKSSALVGVMKRFYVCPRILEKA